ncbi:hypothetical protein Leryth_007401 [Lithospermum erythrorhizon]|nr:hypothetical protein Leryth_007401 [Lithospermum erythrorhizon]
MLRPLNLLKLNLSIHKQLHPLNLQILSKLHSLLLQFHHLPLLHLFHSLIHLPEPLYRFRQLPRSFLLCTPLHILLHILVFLILFLLHYRLRCSSSHRRVITPKTRTPHFRTRSFPFRRQSQHLWRSLCPNHHIRRQRQPNLPITHHLRRRRQPHLPIPHHRRRCLSLPHRSHRRRQPHISIIHQLRRRLCPHHRTRSPHLPPIHHLRRRHLHHRRHRRRHPHLPKSQRYTHRSRVKLTKITQKSPQTIPNPLIQNLIIINTNQFIKPLKKPPRTLHPTTSLHNFPLLNLILLLQSINPILTLNICTMSFGGIPMEGVNGIRHILPIFLP